MFKVGIVGAGPVAQAIHLPTIARLGGRARVTRIMDLNADLAAAVAAPLAAKPCSSLDELLSDPLDVVVIGSPDPFHAGQIEAACAAGVRGILAEKPFATSPDEVSRVVRAVDRSGAAFVVGAMHTYDPAWLAASAAFGDDGPYHVRSSIYLPGNPRFEDMATTMVRQPAAARPAPTPAQLVRGGVLGLAIHNLPLIRRFVPVLDRVDTAFPVSPWGYVLTASGPSGSVELIARTGGTWRPDWTLRVWGKSQELALDFPPSYVHAGSATAALTSADGSAGWGPFTRNGYEAEWRELLDQLDGGAPRYSMATLTEDLGYALRLADLATASLSPEPAQTRRLPARDAATDSAPQLFGEAPQGSVGLRVLAGSSAEVEAAVGTVPADFRLVAGAEGPHVAWVLGGPGWVAEVESALRDGALAVVLDTAGPLSPSDIARFEGLPVLLVGTRTHAPQLTALRAELPALGELELVDVLVVDGSDAGLEPSAALWDTVAMLTAAGLPIDAVPQVVVGEQAVSAQTVIAGARAHLSYVHRPGAVARAFVKVFSSQGSIDAAMGDPTVALPGTVLAVGAADARLASTSYVTPRRVALEEVRAVVARRLASPPGLLDLHSHAADLLAQVTWAGEEQTTPTQLEGTHR